MTRDEALEIRRKCPECNGARFVPMYRTSADGQRVVWSGVGDPHEPAEQGGMDDAAFELIVKKKCCTLTAPCAGCAAKPKEAATIVISRFIATPRGA